MASASASVPSEADMLCEACGYVLNGLPPDSRCPECGLPIADSDAALRRSPVWEQEGATEPLRRFLRTTGELLFQPAEFYRTFATRLPRTASRRFAHIHWLIASVLFAIAGVCHMHWTGLAVASSWDWPLLLLLLAGAYAFLAGLTWLAAKLTTWEATYRGLRLPLGVVRRGMDYHAAHYLPVSLLAAATVVTYTTLMARGVIDARWTVTYLYILCGEVILSAFYLFKTYWTAMRNMMYANA